MNRMKWIAFAASSAMLLVLVSQGRAERIKDICQVKGERSNPLQGYGIVVGLDGTGDDSPITRQALINLLRKQGLTLQPDKISSKNIASVYVTADLPAYGRKGTTIDANVSAVGQAASLQGGTLLFTTLQGADDQVYAIAQGAVIVGGFSAGEGGTAIKKNHTTVGSIPNGATIEREELATVVDNGCVSLQLTNPDYTTAEAIAKVISDVFPQSANAEDAGCVKVRVPRDIRPAEIAGFINRIQLLEVDVDTPAVVVINEKTGTVVVGANVKISTTAITHGNLAIVTKRIEKVVQPLPFSNTGTTAVETNTNVNVVEDKAKVMVVPSQPSVSELARALNLMGVSPRDLISIFKALKKAGALQARLEIM
ncbi:MAG: flagellar basal body P-ring protein FlgI [Planctomycetes bacterium]|nr:flagellar basal body P-ring protein FlgI [Planctomycetota bacterium]